MRFDAAVYLVPPDPTPPSMPTRRAFLIAGVTFAFGAAAGGACGYSIGAAGAVDAAVADDRELEPSGDADLDELRRLAVKAPIEELIEKRLVFLSCVAQDYRRDGVLWSGVERLCDSVRADIGFPDRRVSARLLAQTIELADPEFRTKYLSVASELRSLR